MEKKKDQERLSCFSPYPWIFYFLHQFGVWLFLYLDQTGNMKKIGLALPLCLLIVFAFVFHPSMKIYLMQYMSPWKFILFSPQMFFLLATIVVLAKNKMHPRDIGVVGPFKKNILVGVVTGLIPYFLLLLGNFLAGMFHPSPPNENLYEFTGSMFFSYFVFAPIAEELFFRGILFHSFKESYNTMIAVIASSMVFGACHSSMMVGPLILGVITAWMTLQTGSILPGVFFHSLSNGLPWFYTNYCSHLQPFERYLFFKF